MTTINSIIFSEVVDLKNEQIYLLKKRVLIVNALEFPGCFNAELLSPIPKIRHEWITLVQFETEASLTEWLDSPITQKHLSQLNKYIREGKKLFLPGFNRQVSYLITTLVSPDKETEYLKWENKIGREMSSTPGFLGKELAHSQSIHIEKDKTVWVILYRFNNQDNLRKWLYSEDRKKLIEEGKKIFDYSVVNEFPRGFGNWFNLDGAGKKTPSWKMPLIVQMALYPMVIIQGQLNHFLPNLPTPIIILFNTFWGCFLMQYFLVPWVQKMMRFWLHPQTEEEEKTNIIGVIFAGIYLLVICFLAVKLV